MYIECTFTFIIYENTGRLGLLLWDSNRFLFALSYISLTNNPTIEALFLEILYSKEAADSSHWTGYAVRNFCSGGDQLDDLRESRFRRQLGQEPFCYQIKHLCTIRWLLDSVHPSTVGYFQVTLCLLYIEYPLTRPTRSASWVCNRVLVSATPVALVPPDLHQHINYLSNIKLIRFLLYNVILCLNRDDTTTHITMAVRRITGSSGWEFRARNFRITGQCALPLTARSTRDTVIKTLAKSQSVIVLVTCIPNCRGLNAISTDLI